MARKGLGDVRSRLKERYERDRVKVSHFTEAQKYSDALERRIIAILAELGIDYPLDFDKPSPDVEVFHRQGTITLEPDGSDDGGSPATETDKRCFTFKARDSGFLILDNLDLIMEDPIAQDFTLEYKFDSEQVNSINYQEDQSDTELGHWKFGRIVLADSGSLSICVTNPNANASGVFSIEASGWKL